MFQVIFVLQSGYCSNGFAELPYFNLSFVNHIQMVHFLILFVNVVAVIVLNLFEHVEELTNQIFLNGVFEKGIENELMFFE